MVPERTQARANPARGIALIATAVIVGIFLLRNGQFDGGEAVADAVEEAAQTGTTLPGPGGSGTTIPTQPTRPFAEITIRVANASGVSGAARCLSGQLTEAGYQAAEPTDAPAGTDPAATVVLFAAGFDQEAATLASQVGATPEAVAPLAEPPQIDPAGAQLIAIVGTDTARAC